MTPTREQIQAKMRLFDLEKKRLRVLSRLVILDREIKEISAQAQDAGGPRRATSRRGGRSQGGETCQANVQDRAGAGEPKGPPPSGGRGRRVRGVRVTAS